MPVARLTSSRDIRAVFGSRQSAGSALLVVHVSGNDVRSSVSEGSVSKSSVSKSSVSKGVSRTAADARVAVVAGRKVGNAVDRNRAKRRLRGALRDVRVPHGMDVVVTAKPGLLEAPYTTLCDDLQGALMRAARKVDAA